MECSFVFFVRYLRISQKAASDNSIKSGFAVHLIKSGSSFGKKLLHLISVDHFLYHLTANGTCLS